VIILAVWYSEYVFLKNPFKGIVYGDNRDKQKSKIDCENNS
jgi:hypothetical protein